MFTSLQGNRRLLPSPSSFVSIFRQIMQELEECWWLPDEQAHVGQKLHHSHSNASRMGRTDDRTTRKFPAQEWARLRHDQIGLKFLSAKRWRIQVGESHRHT